MAAPSHFKQSDQKFLTLSNTLDTQFSKLDASKAIVKSYEEFVSGVSGIGVPNYHTSVITLNSLVMAEGGAAAKALGQKIATFPLGIVQPLSAEVSVKFATATTSTAGQVGLGSVIASGAAATLSTATFDNIMDGTTLANVVGAAAATKQVLLNTSGLAGLAVSATSPGPQCIDGKTTAAPIYLNIASTWGAAENLTISEATIRIHWMYVGAGV